MSNKGIIISTAMPDAIANVSGRIAAMFASTAALAAETAVRDGMLALVGTTTAVAYWYDADAVSGDVLSAAGGYWKALDADATALAALAAAGGAALVGLTDTYSKITGTTLQALVNELTTTTGAAMVGLVDTNSRITGTTLQAFINELTTTTGAAMVLAADAGSYYASATKTLEAILAELGPYRVKVASKAVDAAAIAALGASTTGAIDFDAALPAGAVRLGAYIDVTTGVNNAGDTATTAADIGQKDGDTDGWIDGAADNLVSVAKVASPVGALPLAFEGGVVPTIALTSDVNLSTITKGAFTVYIPYYTMF